MSEEGLWLVWFAYLSERVNVGLVEAASAEEACEGFWSEHGDAGVVPAGVVHATRAVPGHALEIRAAH